LHFAKSCAHGMHARDVRTRWNRSRLLQSRSPANTHTHTHTHKNTHKKIKKTHLKNKWRQC
jgi:hypothetical protein